MNFLADECVDRLIVGRLRKDGHEVVYVAEMDPGISDDTILKTANKAGCILVTTDKDFGELVFRQKRVSSGVVLLRIAGLPALHKADIVSSVIQTHSDKIKGAFTVVSPGTVRIRKNI